MRNYSPKQKSYANADRGCSNTKDYLDSLKNDSKENFLTNTMNSGIEQDWSERILKDNSYYIGQMFELKMNLKAQASEIQICNGMINELKKKNSKLEVTNSKQKKITQIVPVCTDPLGTYA